jgi:hypothetical protein
MRTSTIALSLLTGAVLAPLSAHAVIIQFCTPDCVTDTVQFQIPRDAPGGTPTTDPTTLITTTTVPIASFTYGPFTISGTVTSQQSGTLQKITFSPTTITTTTSSGCSVTAPCRLQIIATSERADFPVPKPVGGYPAGAYMMGSFTGTQVVNNGDTIAMTGTAAGLTQGTDANGNPIGLVPVSPDVINNTPDTDPGNVGVSLPSACTGNPGCTFMATTLKKGFSSQISETVQQLCGTNETQCLTQLKTRVDIAIKTSGNKVSLPIDHITTNFDPAHPAINPTVILSQQVAPQFGNIDVNSLAVLPNDFALTANLALSSGDTIDPSTEEVFLSVGDYSATIPPGSFRRIAQGKLYMFEGKVDGRQVVASFVRGNDPKVWTFIVGVHQIQLTGVPHPPLQTPVQIGVGTDIGSDLVAAQFFGNLK